MTGSDSRARGSGRIFLRGRRYWIAYYKHGQEFRESVKTSDPAAAERRLAARLREIGRDDFVGPKLERLKIDEVLQDYETHLDLVGAKAMKAARAKRLRLLEAFAGERVVALTGPVIEAWMTERLAAGVARATVATQAAHLKSALRYASRNGKVARVPYIPGLRLNNARAGFFEGEEFERVLGELAEPLRDVARFGYLTGWRKSEILGLRWADVDRAGGMLRLRDSKTGEGRALPMVGPVLELLEKRWSARIVRIDGARLAEFVFHRGDGRAVGAFNTAWDSACTRAGLPGRLFHDLRRTAVRDMIDAGNDAFSVMQITGHRTLSTLKRYKITSSGRMAEVLAGTQSFRARRTISGQSAETSSKPVKSLRG